MKKGIDEIWASVRVARFINSLGYKEITLKSDTEPAMIASRNRVAENCNAEVTLEDAVEGDKPSKRIGRERSDVVAWCHQNDQVPCGEMHARRTPRRLPNLVVVGGTRGEHLVQVPEGSRRLDAIRGECAGETETTRTVEQNESQIQAWSVAGSEKQQCRVLRGTAEGVFRRIEQQDRWDGRSHQQCDRSPVENC